MTTAWAPAVTRLVAEVIVLGTTPKIRVKTRSGHLIGYGLVRDTARNQDTRAKCLTGTSWMPHLGS